MKLLLSSISIIFSRNFLLVSSTKFFALLVVTLGDPCLSFAQSDSLSERRNYFTYRLSAHYGALLGYKDSHPVLIFPNLYGIEVSFTNPSKGKKRWEKMYNHPSAVYSLAYYNYGLPHDYGEAYTATVSYDFNLLRKSRRALWLTGGTGMVYSTRKFNAETNPFNKAISTDFAYVLQGSLRYDYNLNPNLVFNSSFSFRHFSNATLGIPNNGMNFPLIGAGLTYVPNPLNIRYQKDTLKTFDKKIHFTLSAGLAIKKVLQIDERHKIYMVSFYADRQITKWNSILLGVDLFYNTSFKSEFTKYGLEAPREIDERQVALTLGQELFIGKVGVLAQGAIYLHQPHRFKSNLYQKYGFKYYITKDLFAGYLVKVFVGTADYMEWVVGMRL